MTADVLHSSGAPAPQGPDLTPVLIAAARDSPAFNQGRPWWVGPVDHGVELRTELSRRAPGRTPGAREARISAGAALLAMRLAIADQGFRPVTSLLPDPVRPGVLAVLRRGPAAPPTPVERALHAVRGRCGPTGGEPGPGVVGAAARHRLRRAAEAEGAWLRCAADSAERTPVIASFPPALRRRATRSACLLVVGGHGDLPVAQLRAGSAAQRVVLTARTLGLACTVLAGPHELGGSAPGTRNLPALLVLAVGPPVSPPTETPPPTG